MQPTTIGLDIAKHVFQAYGVDAAGQVVLRRQIRRSELLAFFKALPPCVIGMEACASAHYWAREFRALGHTVRLMPATYVKPYAKRGQERRDRRRGDLRPTSAGASRDRTACFD